MLVQLLPDQVSRFWDIIKFAVDESLPPIVGEHPDRLNRILSSILSGKTQCWASYRRENEKIVFEGICLTKFLYDEASNTKNLLLYSVYGYEKTENEAWAEAFIATSKFAKANGCNEVVGYTNVDHLIEKAKLFGGNTEYTYITFNVEKTVQIINELWGK